MSHEKSRGTNIEISVIATMFQAIIVVFGQYPSRRGWMICPPIRRCIGAIQRRAPRGGREPLSSCHFILE